MCDLGEWGREKVGEVHKISQSLATKGLVDRFPLQNIQPPTWHGTIRTGM